MSKWIEVLNFGVFGEILNLDLFNLMLRNIDFVTELNGNVEQRILSSDGPGCLIGFIVVGIHDLIHVATFI